MKIEIGENVEKEAIMDKTKQNARMTIYQLRMRKQSGSITLK